MKISVFYEHIAEAAEQTGKSVGEICKEISALGVTGVEMDIKRLLDEKDIIQKALYQANLEISCIYGIYDFAHNQDIRDGYKLVDMASDMHVKKIMLIPGFFRKNENNIFNRKKILTKMVNALKSICTYADDKKVMIVLEDFDDKAAYYSNAKGLKYFMDQIPDLYCAFDTGNFLYSEEDSLEVLPAFMNKIKHVHCKDRTFEKKEGEKPLSTVKGRNLYSCPVGSGCIRMREIIDRLIQNGYDDYLAAEHFGSLNQLEDMKKSISWLSEF